MQIAQVYIGQSSEVQRMAMQYKSTKHRFFYNQLSISIFRNDLHNLFEPLYLLSDKETFNSHLDFLFTFFEINRD